MAVPFIHMADIHLSRLQTSGLSAAKLAQRRSDVMLTLLAVLQTVREQHIPLVFIAGDLFEHDVVDKSILNELLNQFAGMPSVHICIAAGNHDYAAPNSFYQTSTWPSNVHLFLADWQTVQLPELGITVHGRGFTAPVCGESCLRNYQVCHDPNMLQVVLLHADCPTSVSDYLPVTRDDLVGCGADYIALGHIHTARILLESGSLARAAYSGALEPLDFGEEGPHGYFHGELTQGGARLRFIPVASRSYHQVKVAVSSASNMEPVLLAAEQALKQIPDTDLVRLVLQGDVSQDFNLDKARLSYLGERFFAFDIVDETMPTYDIAALAAGFSVRACFVRRLMHIMEHGSEEERLQARLALRMGLDALAGREVRLF